MKRIALGLATLAVMLAPLPMIARAQATPEPPTPPQVRQLFEQMTPEERVGQLFLVTFTGTDTGEESQIHDLIANSHVGGVVLQAANDNFVAAPDTVQAAADLTRSLQLIEWNSSLHPPVDPTTGAAQPHAYIPLFVGMSQDGGGPPGDQILSGLTPLPSELAIGATWSTDLADEVGKVMGDELSRLGINMYFGPTLDVLENPNATPSNDLGSTVFGGDPYWVGVLGSAYIDGLHTGAGGRLVVVPKHFPGRGSADRSSDQEVATVRKSLEQLKQIELAPFSAVTRQSATRYAQADGLLVSHIRYQGFQGNIRATTKPVSFDAQALSTILSLDDFAAWRANGGVIISDDLGTNAVRQFYETGTEFPARTVARDAFVAGNDMLYLGNIVASDAPDNYTTVLEILSFFSKKYREDPAFAQRVDASALRILSLKFHLFGVFSPGAAMASAAPVTDVGDSQQVTLDVASKAATLLSPSAQDLAAILPAPPKVRDRIIFFTDTSEAQQCSTCPPVPDLAVDGLQHAIVNLYGPQGGNQTSSFRLSSYSFEDATNLLAGENPPYLEDDLTSAAWIVFGLANNDHGQAQLISNFLSDEQDLLRDKKVILFAFGSPYYLDATDISRLTAYYALYSKGPPFVQVAARLLFQEITPTGAAPVSIPGLGYDLISTTAPDPNQIISLALDLPEPPQAPTGLTPQPTEVPLFRIGDTIGIRTGMIKDHNGEPVPDGTVVEFSMNLTGEGGGILQQAQTTTSQGVARVSFGLDKPGLLQIKATSEPALVSDVLQLDVSSAGAPAAVTVIVPPLTPEAAPRVEPTAVPVENEFISPAGTMRFSAWLLTVLLLAVGAVLAGLAGNQSAGPSWAVRWGLLAMAGGLLPYNYIALGLPGSTSYAADNGIGGVLILAALGVLAGWGIGWLWWRGSSSRSG